MRRALLHVLLLAGTSGGLAGFWTYGVPVEVSNALGGLLSEAQTLAIAAVLVLMLLLVATRDLRRHARLRPL